jgi:opacity protein-like surface antigen
MNNMNRILGCVIVAIIIAFAAISATAQEIYKWEVFGGFSYAHYDNILNAIDNTIDPNISLRGVNASVVGNFHKYVGLKFDYAFLSNRKTYSGPTGTVLEAKYKNNEFMGGVQFKNNLKDSPTWKPFGHILAGAADQRLNVNGSVVVGGLVRPIADSRTTNNFTMVFGAGLDVRVHKNVDIRLIQFDYNPVFFKERTIDTFVIPGKTQNNIRLSFGVAFH